MDNQAKQIATIIVAGLAVRVADAAEVSEAIDAADADPQADPVSVALTGDARRVQTEEPEISVRPRYERFQAEDGTFVCIDNSNNRQVDGALCQMSDEIWIA